MVACGACGRGEFAAFFRTREWHHSGLYLSSPADQGRGEPINILLEYCRVCGLIRQAPGHEVTSDYVEISRDTAKQLPDYTQQIIDSLRTFNVGSDKPVLEVGANDGTFLCALRDAGYTNLLGVEPSQALANRAMRSGLSVSNEYFGAESVSRLLTEFGPAEAVICRHTLEHVPDIRDMIEGISAMLANGGLAFIEVPDADWVTSELFAHEIWDEHLTYFAPHALATLLRSVDLLPVRMQRQRFRDTRNLLCWAVRRPSFNIAASDVVDEAIDWQQLASFQSRWDTFAARLRTAVKAAPDPLICIGASHIQLNFLNFAGLAGDVGLLIDDDPVKADHFAPLAVPTPIRNTTQALAAIRGGTVLRTAFPYPAWEDRICGELAPRGISCIKPYEFR